MLNIFENRDFFSGLFHTRTFYFFLIETFCKVINAFTVTFDQLNVPLLNKSTNLSNKKRPLTYIMQYTVVKP